MAGEELTRFPITPQERHRTAKSSDDIEARPEEQRPGRSEDSPQDKPVIPAPQQAAQGGPDGDDEDMPDEVDADGPGDADKAGAGA